MSSLLQWAVRMVLLVVALHLGLALWLLLAKGRCHYRCRKVILVSDLLIIDAWASDFYEKVSGLAIAVRTSKAKVW